MLHFIKDNLNKHFLLLKEAFTKEAMAKGKQNDQYHISLLKQYEQYESAILEKGHRIILFLTVKQF